MNQLIRNLRGLFFEDHGMKLRMIEWQIVLSPAQIAGRDLETCRVDKTSI